jgi:hypothetical protein
LTASTGKPHTNRTPAPRTRKGRRP